MDNIPPSPIDLAPIDAVSQKEIEAIANEIVDVEFDNLWSQVQDKTQNLSQKELATEFFYQGIMAVLTIQKLEEKQMEEEEARRFQNE